MGNLWANLDLIVPPFSAWTGFFTMIASTVLIAGILLVARSALAFTGLPQRMNPACYPLRFPRRTDTMRCWGAQSTPTIKELSTDDFIKQVSHSQKIVQMLVSDPLDGTDDGSLLDLLKAQLSHSDGIRGFFVTYLTADGDDTPADQPQVPASLLTAMDQSANEKEIVSLACMNVIMPTGMITMHKDPTLSSQSKKTAERGIRVLRSLRLKSLVKQQCQAILAVATSSNADGVDPIKVAYWEAFFEKWGYQDAQKRDIAKAVKRVLSD